MKPFRAGRAAIWILWISLVSMTGCELTRDYRAVPLLDGAAEGKRACESPQVDGTVFYVSPDGSADADGTRDAPWDPETAAENIGPGVTLLFLEGTYRMSFKPAVSGQVGAPIVLRSEQRHQAKMAGVGGNAVSFNLDDRSHIRVEGFKFVRGSDRWIDVIDSENIVLSDLWLEDHYGVGPPLRINDSEDVALVNSVARKSYKYRIIHAKRSSRLHVAGNAFSMSLGQPLLVDDSDHVLIRANVFHNQIGKSVYLRSNQGVLFEHNVVTNAAQGPGASNPEAEISGEHIVFRYNRVYRNWGAPFQLNVDDSDQFSRHARIYHNVIDDTRDEANADGEGWSVLVADENLDDAVFKNNVFSRNGREHDNVQVVGERWDGEASFVSNVFWVGPGELPTVRVDGVSHSLDEAAAEMPEAFVDNFVGEPEYLDGANFDHRLAARSPLVDTGQALTATRSQGPGTSLPVEDAHYFFDGFGIDGQVGDLIGVGRPAQVARVVAVDRGADTLILDRSVDWSAGDDVHLVWAGDGPDIGAWEHRLSEATPAAIERSSFVVEAGSPVELRAHLWDGIEPARVQWRLGDGTLTCGRAFEHTYEEAGDYPIRLEIIDEDGRVYRAASYVLVAGSGVDVDSVEYNKQLMDDYLCDGEARGYTGGQSGHDRLVERDEQGYVCAP